MNRNSRSGNIPSNPSIVICIKKRIIIIRILIPVSSLVISTDLSFTGIRQGRVIFLSRTYSWHECHSGAQQQNIEHHIISYSSNHVIVPHPSQGRRN